LGERLEDPRKQRAVTVRERFPTHALGPAATTRAVTVRERFPTHALAPAATTRAVTVRERLPGTPVRFHLREDLEIK